MTAFHLTFHSVNEPIEFKKSHISFLTYLQNKKTITPAFNVQNALYMEPSDENNDFSCIYFCKNLI